MNPYATTIEVEHHQRRLRREAAAHRLASRARDDRVAPGARLVRLRTMTVAVATVVILVAVVPPAGP